MARILPRRERRAHYGSRRAPEASPMSSLVIAAALGSGLVAGIWFTFSNFVMPALAGLPAAQGLDQRPRAEPGLLRRLLRDGRGERPRRVARALALGIARRSAGCRRRRALPRRVDRRDDGRQRAAQPGARALGPARARRGGALARLRRALDA